MGIYKCIMCNGNYGPLLADPFGMAKGVKTRDGNYACSDRCARDYNSAHLNSGGNFGNSGNNSSSNANEPEKKSGGFLGGLMGGGGGSSILDSVGAASLFASVDAENKEIRDKVEYVSKMIFSTNPDELSNQMNELLTIGAGTDTKHKELIKACYEKMDFGVMKLKGLGADVESDFFAKKRESIKPKGMFGF